MGNRKVLFWVTFFAIAMGFLESAVVIYLRQIYYQHGFSFPLQPIDHNIAIVEIWREAATIIMMLSVGILAGKSRAERFAWFIYSFAVWDICYYVFLYVFLGWPQSLLDWDILFLIPVPWVGPVIAPVIISIAMILFALTIANYAGKGRKVAMVTRESVLLITGSLVVIASFTEDYIRQKGDILYRNLRNGGSLFTDLANYVPAHFDWWLFSAGTAVILLSWALYARRIQRIS